MTNQTDDEIHKKIKRKYWDKNEGWESGYMDEAIEEAISKARQSERQSAQKEELEFLNNLNHESLDSKN